MSYDNNGMRTQKGNTYYYYDSGNNLVGMTENGYTLLFYYDESGSPIAFSCGNLMYYYIKNLQGDIAKIVNSNGSVVATYAYDVSGIILSELYDESYNSISAVKLNPLRYRGYVYDDETGLYYLQSRYYDPVTTRFINADVYCDTNSGSPLSTNMYAYCENNAVHKHDANGEDAWWIQSPDSAPFLGIHNGHTSLLIQEKPGYWWYFYWSGESIQLLFIGTTSLKELTGYVDRMLIMYNRVYDLDLEYDDCYKYKISFSGDFSNSLKWVENYISKLLLRTYLLRYNPQVSDWNHIWYYYDVTRIKSSRENYLYKGKYRPYSKLIVFNNNPNYYLLTNNCMHMSIEALLKGSFKSNDYYYKKTLKLIKNNVSAPNIAFEMISFFYEMSKAGFPLIAYSILDTGISNYNRMNVKILRNCLQSFINYFT